MKRSEVKQQYKWAIEDIYATDEAWEKDFEKAEKSITFSKYAGKLGNADILLKFFKEDDEFGKLLERLAVYAHMRHDEDAGDTKYGAMYSRIGSLFARFSTEMAFFDPEMAAQDEKYLKNLIAD